MKGVYVSGYSSYELVLAMRESVQDFVESIDDSEILRSTPERTATLFYSAIVVG